MQLTLTDRGIDIADEAMVIVRALDGRLTAALGGPHSAAIRDLGAALQTLLREAPGPDATPETGEDP